jgi:hypothetical protein
MSDRERTRRPEPARTEPVRHPSAAFRGDARSPGPSPAAPVAATPDTPASAHAAGSDPFGWPGDDPVSRAVRAGCEVVETAVRRGFGLGRYPAGAAGAWGSGNGTSWPGAWSGGQPGWSTGQWVDAMTGAVTLWAQWIDAWSAMARSVITGGAEPAGAWSSPRSPSPPSPPSPAAAPATGTGALHLAVELRTARAASVQLDLASVPAPGVALEVHGLLAPPAAAAPPITDVTVSVADDGGVTVALGSLEHHPAGTYAGAVLAAGRACGTLTVRLT